MSEATREERILEMVLAPGFRCYPSNLNDGMVVVIDGRTGLDACEKTAAACFDVLLDEIDGRGSPGRVGLVINEDGLPELKLSLPTGPA